MKRLLEEKTNLIIGFIGHASVDQISEVKKFVEDNNIPGFHLVFSRLVLKNYGSRKVRSHE